MCRAQVSFLSQGQGEKCVPERGWVGGAVWETIGSVKDELFLGGGISDYFNLMPYAFLLSILLIFYREDIFLF